MGLEGAPIFKPGDNTMKHEYEYNAERINQAISARRKMVKACRKIALDYSPCELPESVIARICSRRKLYNFLESLDLSHESIQSVFWAHGLSVPKDTSLKPTAEPKPEKRIEWLDLVNFINDEDFHI